MNRGRKKTTRKLQDSKNNKERGLNKRITIYI